MHLAPAEGEPRPVATAIVDGVVSRPARRAGSRSCRSTGTNGKTTTARITAHLLAQAGYRTGLTSTDGVYIGGRLVQRADATGPRSAQMVLSDPSVDAAVLETARGGLLRQGLGYDWADVGVITNLSADHLGQDGIESMDDLVHVKALVAERVRDGGTLVLNADDPRVRDLIVRPADPGRAQAPDLVRPAPARAAHRAPRRERRHGLRRLERLPGRARRAGRDRAAAGRRGAGRFRGRRAVRGGQRAGGRGRRAGAGPVGGRGLRGARDFDAAHDNPGRGQLFELGGVHLLVDYAHNPAAITALGELVHDIWGTEHAVAAVTLPGDRRDDLIADCARAVADAFHRVVLYEDVDLRGRSRGEVPELVRGEIAARRPELAVTTVTTVAEAVPAALAMANPGDVVVLLYEAIAPALEVLVTLGARAITQPHELARLRAVTTRTTSSGQRPFVRRV